MTEMLASFAVGLQSKQLVAAGKTGVSAASAAAGAARDVFQDHQEAQNQTSQMRFLLGRAKACLDTAEEYYPASLDDNTRKEAIKWLTDEYSKGQALLNSLHVSQHCLPGCGPSSAQVCIKRQDLLSWLELYEQEIRALTKESIDAEHAYKLGVACLQGETQTKTRHSWRIIEKDPERAMKLFERAAEKGHRDALFQLGNLYGNVYYLFQLPYDLDKAEECYRKAADQGHAAAQVSIEAVVEGDAEAQIKVGDMYYFGTNVPKCSEKAEEFYRKAADQGHTVAQLIIRAITQNEAEAQYDLGCRYFDGNGVLKALTKAAYFFEKAAAQGHADAQYHLGVMYQDGSGIQKDPEQAHALVMKAADQGHTSAQYVLGIMYQHGEARPAVPVEAVRIFTEAAERADDALRPFFLSRIKDIYKSCSDP